MLFFNMSEEFQFPFIRIPLFTILLYFVCLFVCVLALPLACATDETWPGLNYVCDLHSYSIKTVVENAPFLKTLSWVEMLKTPVYFNRVDSY